MQCDNPSMKSRQTQPRNLGRLAKSIADLATGNPITGDPSPIAGKERDPAVGAAGRSGAGKTGKNGGNKSQKSRKR
jgi:hypothetical protein